MSYPTRDWLKYSDAKALAQQITDYWATQGKTIKTKTEGYGPINANSDHSVFAVRSDMIGGKPRS